MACPTCPAYVAYLGLDRKIPTVTQKRNRALRWRVSPQVIFD